MEDDSANIHHCDKNGGSKPLSLLLTNILTAVKEKFQTNCATTYARSGVNQMWILKNSKEILANLKALNK
jgi:hypothetical protein